MCFCTCGKGEGYDGLLISTMAKAWLVHRRKLEVHLRPLAQLPGLCCRPVGCALTSQITHFPAKSIQALHGFVLSGSVQQEQLFLFCCDGAELGTGVAKAGFWCSTSTYIGCPPSCRTGPAWDQLLQEAVAKASTKDAFHVPYNRGPKPTQGPL